MIEVEIGPLSELAALDQRVTDLETDIASVGGDVTDKADKATIITADGLLSGTHDLSTDFTLSVPKASNEDVDTGTDDAAAVTSATLQHKLGGITVTAQGLALGGGNLGTSFNINVPKATNADIDAGTDDAKAVTSAGLQRKINSVVNAAPGQLDTLDELAAALGDDANFAATMTTALAGKAATTTTITADGLLSGTHSLASSFTLSVAKASAMEVAAKTEDGKAVTPHAMAAVTQGVADNAAAIATEAAARSAADSAEQAGRIAADTAEQTDRIAGDTALSDRIDPYEASIATPAEAPASPLVRLDAEVTDFSGLRIDGMGVWLGAEAYEQAPADLENIASIVVDVWGRVGQVVDFQGRISDGSSDFGEVELEARNQRALALSAAVNQPTEALVAGWGFGYTHFLEYGQSLSTGNGAWRALTDQSESGVLMLGDSVRPSGTDTSTFTPYGSAVLNPMVATVQDPAGTELLDAAAVAALTSADQNPGETPLEAAINMCRKLWLRHLGLVLDNTRQFVGSSCGRPSKTIEQLSPGGTGNLWGRVTDCADQVKAIADGESKTYGVGAVFWIQGEDNYAGHSDGTRDRAEYKALLEDLRVSFNDEVAGDIAGQGSPPVFITYQTGGEFTHEDTDLSIGRAQFEFAEETPGAYLASPVYPVPNIGKGGHLDPNGSRWLGCQMGKVAFRTAMLGQGWKPLHPIRATWRGRSVAVDFHVPCPPLQFRPVINMNGLLNVANSGFRLIDAVGEVDIDEVTLAGDAVVLITCRRALVAPVQVYYALDNGMGYGNLCDSDPTVAPFNYEYEEGSGQFAEANLSELVGKPYPLWNWCVAFKTEALADGQAAAALGIEYGDALATEDGDTLEVETGAA